MEFIVVNDPVINAERVLAIAHSPDTLKLRPDYATEAEIPSPVKHFYELRDGRWVLFPDIRHSDEAYSVMFDTGKELKLKLQDGKPLVERFRTLSKPSDGKIATTSEDAT